MSRIEDLVGQLPLIEEALEHSDDIYSRIIMDATPEGKQLKTIIDDSRNVLEDLKAFLEKIEAALPDSLFKELADAKEKYSLQNATVKFDQIPESLIKKVISLNKFARQLGYANIDRLKADISRDPIRTLNEITKTLFDSWATYKSKIQNSVSGNQFGQTYSGPYFISKLFEDAKKTNPPETNNKELNALLGSDQKIEIYINDLTALSILPEEPVLAWMYMMVVLSEDLNRFRDSISQSEQDYISLKLEYDNDVDRRRQLRTDVQTESDKKTQLVAENGSLLSKNATLNSENERLDIEIKKKGEELGKGTQGNDSEDDEEEE